MLAVAAAALAITPATAGAISTYEVSRASGSPNITGDPARPVPGRLDFGFEVGDTDGLRPAIVKRYAIAAEGVRYFAKARPACTFAQADAAPAFEPACKKAIVGGGSIVSEFGVASDRTLKGPCQAKVTLINIRSGPGVTARRGGIAIRIDTDPPACPLSVHAALAAPIFDVTLGGVRSSELRFEVPDNLVHPAPGVDNSVVSAVAHVARKTGSVRIGGRLRSVGFASAVGRRGAKRTVRVRFAGEDGSSQTATTTFPR